MTQEHQLKVFEFAKEIGVETLTLMDKIREWKLPVRSHMATLDDEMQAEIRNRLAASTAAAAEEAAKAKKKAVRKKAADAAAPAAATKKAAAAKAPAPSKTPAKPVTKAAAPKATGAAKTVTKTKAKAAAAAAPEAAPAPVTTRSVIRRKAGEAEEKAKEAAALAAAEAEAANIQALEEASQTEPVVEAPVGSPTPEGADAAAAAAPAETAPKPRRNIVGRMDLRRVANIQGTSGGAGAGAAGPRTSRTAPRSIRTGFYSPDQQVAPPTGFGEDRRPGEVKEDPRKKRPGPGGAGAGGGGREEEVKIFTATEFRKREVIFQPKKKKSMVGGRDTKKTQLTTPAAHKRVVKVEGTITLNNLAAEIGIKAPLLMKKLMAEGVQASMNTALDFDTVALIVPEFGWEAQNTHKSVAELLSTNTQGADAELVTRPPVVTIMGHVDHGKTTLLDSIRKANVAKGEAGGITQHIGAYSVTLEDGAKVTFIDTPGHEAFTAMRARGANATDIAIIVVAADDGMMPQTAEAINHAKAAGVPIIVAVNKMDKPGANPERIKQQLTELELVPEEWGGTTIYVPVAALKGEGIKELLEQIHLVAEIAELKANPKRAATGIVIEARMEKGRGSVATILVKDGTVRTSDLIVAGQVTGRVRSMMDDQGKVVKEMGPGMAVEVLGLPEPPMAGDAFDVVADEETGRRIALQRKSAVAQAETPNSKMSLEQLFSRVKSGDTKELSLIMKADVAGSLEAIKGQLDKLGNDEVKIKLIHSAVGGITESDVLLANTSKGVIVGFNVRPDGGAARMAKEKGIEIKSYSIIYELMDDLKKALGGLLQPTVVEKSLGRAEVRNVFNVPKGGTIAGSFVTDGKIARNSQLRLVRDGKIIYEGKVGSLKRFKDDAKEVASGFECGIGIENFNDIKVGDVIESFVKEEQVREL